MTVRKITLTLFLFFLSLNQALAVYYYRGDHRTPQEIKSAGGFYPPTLPNGIPNRSTDMSLYNHVKTMEISGTGYVSTTSSVTMASRFGSGYIYVLQGDSNLVDVSVAMGAYNPYPREMEFAAIGGIPWGQVVGWYRDSTFDHPGTYVRNPDYQGSGAFTGVGNSIGAQVYPLAGFPADHPAWNQLPWSQYAPPGCTSQLAASNRLATQASDTCTSAKQQYGWAYLVKYRADKGVKKTVTSQGSVSSAGLFFPSSNKTWIDMDGNGWLSLCGLFYDSEGSRTKITCSKNNSNYAFTKIVASLSDYGWTDGGQAFTTQDGKVAFCRLVDNWTKPACAKSINGGYFNSDYVARYDDGGYADTRGWRSVYADGSTAFCRILIDAYNRYSVVCTRLNGSETSFTPADVGWTDSRIWLDMQGLGTGHAAYCRLIGHSTKLQCTLRTNDNQWSGDLTSDYIDGGYSGYRYAIRMHGKAQEYCAVTGGSHETLTCTFLKEDKTFSTYTTNLPERINNINLSLISPFIKIPPTVSQNVVSFSDVDGDGRDDMCVLDRANKAVSCYLNKGGAFNSTAITLNLSVTPLGNFSDVSTKIMPIEYTDKGPVSTVCYNAGYGSMRCDKFLVF